MADSFFFIEIPNQVARAFQLGGVILIEKNWMESRRFKIKAIEDSF
jgi:hypothetical protein